MVAGQLFSFSTLMLSVGLLTCETVSRMTYTVLMEAEPSSSLKPLGTVGVKVLTGLFWCPAISTKAFKCLYLIITDCLQDPPQLPRNVFSFNFVDFVSQWWAHFIAAISWYYRFLKLRRSFFINVNSEKAFFATADLFSDIWSLNSSSALKLCWDSMKSITPVKGFVKQCTKVRVLGDLATTTIIK